MRDCVLDPTTRVVDILQLLIVLRLVIHLDFERVDFEQQASLGCGIFSARLNTSFEIFEGLVEEPNKHRLLTVWMEPYTF